MAENSEARDENEARFVIHEHDASGLHYDFRLEADGALKSWAVPKGPSTDPGEKRLAVPTDDHPIDYLDFEGVIPEGDYGAGTVIVWDTGTFANESEDGDGNPLSVVDAITGGQVSVSLRGQKLSGGYALIRTGSGEDRTWLLVKKDDEAADARRNPTSTETKSVLSGRTIEEVANQEEDGS